MQHADYNEQRQVMVSDQLDRRGIGDKRVLKAMLEIPRHLFVPSEHQIFSYSDGPLPIGFRQTISQPYIVALMSELLELKGTEKVLEVGTGSGYQTAVLSYLARLVYTIETIEELSNTAKLVLRGLGFGNIHFFVGDGSQGLVKHEPFDAILVTAAAPTIPQPLIDQLADPGCIVAPVGECGRQQFLYKLQKQQGKIQEKKIAPVAFVPLSGRYGWGD